MAAPRVVIIGGGFAGLDAAKALARAPVAVTVIDRRNHHLFQPLLYQVATAVLSPGEIAQPIRGILRGQKNLRVLMGEVTDIDLEGRRVLLAGEVVPYDYLIVAAGASHSYFGHDEWEPFAPGLKSLDDALDIRSRILSAFEEAERTDDPAKRPALMTFVIVGAGPTGVELAGAIAEICHHSVVGDYDRIDPRTARIILIEALDRALPPFPPDLSGKAERALRDLGVELRFGQPVTDIAPGHVTVGGEEIPCETAIWAAGVKAAGIGAALGAERDRAGRVRVAPDLTVPGHPNVFAVGDLAALAQANGKPVPGVAPAAKQQGAHAAANVLRSIRGEPRRPFVYRDKGDLAIIGRNKAVARIGKLKLSGAVAWLAWLTIHLAYLNGFRNRIAAVLDWFFMYVTFRRNVLLLSRTRTNADMPSPAAPAGTPAGEDRAARSTRERA
ncbi:MAG TPA: NAD(P)/FAD-dependent oxidoreductase [Thermomicrobiales bacterium]|nr:NAD(P)/FAD-dependent oxidoreductase [Thermomicrobiales bacterium]